MGVEIKQGDPLSRSSSILLELAATDDIVAFKSLVEKNNNSIDEPGLWYTRRIGIGSSYGYELRTPLMVAAQYGSLEVLNFIISSNMINININQVTGSDRITALHCAVTGGSGATLAIVDRLVAASADVDILSGSGHKAGELIPRLPIKKQQETELQLESLLQYKKSFKNSDHNNNSESESENGNSPRKQQQQQVELPDINTGAYSTDDFRMYCFKIKPCSRAYTHDWTECPFAHPGENARRRDPMKCQYTCVPCPEFKKGACKKGDDCEFAHGVFESWLHPAQYRTRLCKDETGCARKVCFFAHKREELRPVYASTGSALPDMPVSGVSSPPLSPSFAPGSPKSRQLPSLQLQGSRLRTSVSARDVDYLSPRHGPSPRWNNNGPDSMLEMAFSPIGVGRMVSSPRMAVEPISLSSPKHVAAAMLNSRAAAFAAQRSQSFVDRGAPMMGQNLSSQMSGGLTDWGSPNGKLDWGVTGQELNKLRKSNSFGFRGNGHVNANIGNGNGNGNGNHMMRPSPPGFNEPDVSWVNSLVKDDVRGGFFAERGPNYGGGNGEMWSPWVEQLYMEQEQLVA